MNGDNSLIFFLIAVLVIVISIKAIAKSRFFSMRNAGLKGERRVCQELSLLEGYKKILSNCYLPKADGTLTEVDVILLHKSGIYVIESKNFSGWIFGKDYEQYWTQSFGRRTSQKTRFFNPIMQNAVHVKWLREYIGRDFPIYSYVVFSDHCSLKKIEVTKPGYFVTNYRSLLPAIRQNAIETPYMLSDATIDDLYQTLLPLTQVTVGQKIQHAQTVQQKMEERSAFSMNNPVRTSSMPSQTVPINGGKCPRCGGTLVLRTAKSGERAGKKLWGCSNYPQCRFIEDVEEIELKPPPTVATGERKCPQCGGTLVLRTVKSGERAGKKLWGCSNYPQCHFIEDVEEVELKPPPVVATGERKCPQCGGTLVLRTVKTGERAGKKLWGCSNYPQCRFIENVEEEDLKPSPAVATEERKCPQCGGTLVLRIAKSGERAGKKLWGCSNYPNCRFIENIEES